MPLYRVGGDGIRVINPDGSGYSLPTGTVIDEIPNQYEGTLIEVEGDSLLDRKPFQKRVRNYADKMIRPAEDKSL
ncbi:MAG TPA: hypothetical protein VFV93_02470 [Thermomicrobiales bacterium]|nr:hypothetical protein [Thermomicrobiales bacterium]